MEENQEFINEFLTTIFNEILKIEQIVMAKAFPKLSVNEVHVISAVCETMRVGADNRATAVAKKLGITAGSLTAAVTNLERKGYLVRRHDEKDRRVVRIYPTENGKSAYRYHEKFHSDMVSHAIENLKETERQVLVKALVNIETFFREQYEV